MSVQYLGALRKTNAENFMSDRQTDGMMGGRMDMQIDGDKTYSSLRPDRNPMESTWISITKVDWKWKWDGVTAAPFTNWAKGEPWSTEGSPKWINHASMQGLELGNTWKPTGSWAKWPPIAFVCKAKPTSPRSTCADRKTNCASEIQELPTICQDYVTFAWQQCPKSCGVCDQDSAGTCSVPSDGANVVKVKGGSELKQGEAVTYKCQNGFGLSGGNLKRACLDGQLTGSEPVCVDISTLVTLTSHVELTKRSFVPGNYKIYIGGGEEFQISRSGEITKFEFFSVLPGNCLLQVYRPVGGETSTMTLVANYMVSTNADRSEVFHVAKGDRVKVEPGDRLALWYDYTRGGICYDACTDTTKTGLQSSGYIYWSSNFNVGNDYEFVANTKCQTFSFRAVIGPAS
ncbi:uncharacterized protein LOC121380845 [Gigantopelta aegis]|uniref:uncharacterized protein LOC121380845 n=1 Tax=Gigantopelta aegis TaxID=1735272 RepID=UPI001B88A6C2|nr:uncharacterized protein LOC121380845 [Gigantopelta aegis]